MKLLSRLRNSPTNVIEKSTEQFYSKELFKRRVADSGSPTELYKAEEELKLSTSVELQERFGNSLRMLRVGKLLEYIDSFVGVQAYRYMGGYDDSKYTIVTAAADQLNLLPQAQLAITNDIRFSSRVTYTGSTSMEIMVDVSPAQHEHPYFSCLFVMVVRNAQHYELPV